MITDLQTGRFCADVCARAYAEATLESPLAQVLLIPATFSSPLTVAFRGSANIRAWLTDFCIRLAHTPYGRIHIGFWTSTSSVMPGIREALQKSGPAPVLITGHSKGGAEALICARLLAETGQPIQAVHTFGGPRTGNAAWRKNYAAVLGDKTIRWIHEEDIGPRMPPWISGYRHPPHEAFLDAFGSIALDPTVLLLAASDLWGSFWGYKQHQLEQIVTHPISAYQQHLATL